MGMPLTNKEIIVIRQGGANPQYDENSNLLIS